MGKTDSQEGGCLACSGQHQRGAGDVAAALCFITHFKILQAKVETLERNTQMLDGTLKMKYEMCTGDCLRHLKKPKGPPV
jgi:hypothetical protein